MNKRIVIISIVAIFLIVKCCCFSKQVRLLEEFDFARGDWLLVKGYAGDSVQYMISDLAELNLLKEEWILCETERNFATTGGYVVKLYCDKEIVLSMDLIYDNPHDVFGSGILAHYQKGTLAYKNLNWLEKGKWKKIRNDELRSYLYKGNDHLLNN